MDLMGLKRSVLIGLVIVVIVSAGAVLAWYTQRNAELSEEPPRGGSTAASEPPVSRLAVEVEIPFSVIVDAANAAAPGEFTKGDTPRHCQRMGPYDEFLRIDLRRDVCMDYRYDVTVRRDGAIRVAPSPDPARVRVTVPVSFSGNGGFRGDLAGVLGLDRKNFRGALNVHLEVAADLNESSCSD
jgi:hypothetical protein